VDLRWNKLGNQGAKTILKGLNLNKTIIILELSGNRVSDEILRQLNEFLTRNKSGEPIMSRALPNDSSLSLNKRTNLTAAGGNIGVSPSKIAPSSDIGVVIPSRILEEDPVAADGGDFLYER
jgi:hypothetical protein